MCTRPRLIPNPNFGCASKGFGFMKDCVSKYIKVPCGVCPDCVRSKQMQIVQRVQMESLENYLFYCTITYNDESMPWFICADGRRIRYAEVSDVQNMVKRLRKSGVFGRPFRYFGVSELGTKKGRPH